MRFTEPKVRLVAHPQIDWDVVNEYLTEVGGEDWIATQTDKTEEGKIQAFAADGESLVEIGGRLCYRSWKPGLNVNVSRVRTDRGDYFENILKSGHGSVLEHANWSFVISDVSRVFTHELVRHKAGTAVSQESMRFVRLTDIPFWFPEWAQEDTELMRRNVDLLRAMEEHQIWMAEHFGLDDKGVPFAEKKAKTSFMRRFAPDGVSTALLWTANIRALRHVVTMRTEPSAEEEIRLVFDKVAQIMQKEAPLLWQDFEREDDGTWRPGFRKV